jgi:hypothetical protein
MNSLTVTLKRATVTSDVTLHYAAINPVLLKNAAQNRNVHAANLAPFGVARH